MGSININFADVENAFETIEEGRYPVVVEKVEVRESKSSDHPYLNWELTITEGEHEGRKLWQITSLSPKAFFRLKDQFMSLGLIDGDEEDFPLEWDDDVDITPTTGPLVISPELAGVAATALVTIDYDYDPKGRNKVDELVAAEEAGATRSAPKSSGRPKAKASGSASGRRALR